MAYLEKHVFLLRLSWCQNFKLTSFDTTAKSKNSPRHTKQNNSYFFIKSCTQWWYRKSPWTHISSLVLGSLERTLQQQQVEDQLISLHVVSSVQLSSKHQVYQVYIYVLGILGTKVPPWYLKQSAGVSLRSLCVLNERGLSKTELLL